MSQGQNGFGPPGSRFPHCLFVHEIKPSRVGTEITLIIDDQDLSKRLLVSYPPDDTEWRDKYLQVIEPGPPSIRSCNVIAPPGQSIVAFRPMDEYGQPITQLCCIFRIQHQDWLSDQLAKEQLAEFATKKEYDPRQEQEEMNSRLYTHGDSYNCCLCGGVVPEMSGYHFKQLSKDQVRAIQLMSSVAKEFPFVCQSCYQTRMGFGKAAMGSAAGFQGWLISFAQVLFRGYVMAMIGFNFFGVKPYQTQAIIAWSFAGSFVAFERVPALIAAFFRNPLVMMISFLFPVALMAIGFANPEMASRIWASPLAFLGPQFRFWKFEILEVAVYGGAAGFLLGGLLGTIDPRAQAEEEEEEVFRSPLA